MGSQKESSVDFNSVSVEEWERIGVDVGVWVGVVEVGAVIGYRFQVVSVTEHVVDVSRNLVYPASVDVPVVGPKFQSYTCKRSSNRKWYRC